MAFESLSAPKTFSEFHMVIVMFGFYRPCILYYEFRILPFRQILRHGSPSGTHKQVLWEIIGKIWVSQHDILMKKLKYYIKGDNLMSMNFSE